MTKNDYFGPWVRVKNAVMLYGLVHDWRQDPVTVQLGDDGPFEKLYIDALEIVTRREFEKFLSNPVRSQRWKFLEFEMQARLSP